MPVMVHLARPQKMDSIQRFFNARLISNRRPTPALDGFLNV